MSSYSELQVVDDSTVPVNLVVLEAKIGAVIDEEERRFQAAQTSSKFMGGVSASDGDLLVDAAVTKVTSGIPGSKIMGVAATAHGEMGRTTQSGQFPWAKTAGKGSMFIGQARGETLFNDGRGGSSLGPTSYSDRKSAAQGAGNRDGKKLVSDANVASMSLTGVSGSGGKPFRMKGVKAALANSSYAIPDELKDALDGVRAAQQGPMTRANLQHGLNQGLQQAEDFARVNPKQAGEMLRA